MNHRFSKVIAPFRDGKWLVAVSGGIDSVALFYLALHMRRHFQLDFQVAYIHHGPGSDGQEAFRSQAQAFVKNLCDKENVSYCTNSMGPGGRLSSEKEFRDFRYQQLETLRCQNGAKYLVLGHHAGDLLETRLIQLIRGVGPQGMAAMKLVRDRKLRPLLEFQRKELKAYLESLGGQWVEDPSNQSTDYLRNWIRTRWLPSLESQRQGAVKTLARSLESLVPVESPLGDPCFDSQGLRLDIFYTLSPSDKRRVLAAYFLFCGLEGYGLSHINELLKRLDTPRKGLKFRLLKRDWHLDAGRLKVLGLGEIEPTDG